MSPPARSLQPVRELGSQARVVEKWNPFARVRQDLFGGDILARKPGEPGLIVQATSASNHVARMEIWSWVKQGPRGSRKTWHLRRELL